MYNVSVNFPDINDKIPAEPMNVIVNWCYDANTKYCLYKYIQLLHFYRIQKTSHFSLKRGIAVV